MLVQGELTERQIAELHDEAAWAGRGDVVQACQVVLSPFSSPSDVAVARAILEREGRRGGLRSAA